MTQHDNFHLPSDQPPPPRPNQARSPHPPPRVPMPPAPPSRVVPPPPPFVPAYRQSTPTTNAIPEGSKSFIVTLLLAYFLGIFGADRFYLGKTRSGVVKLLTFGGFGYWMIIDLLLTLFGRQRDAWGFRLEGYEKHKKTAWIVVGAVFGAVALTGAVTATVRAAVGPSGPTAFGWALTAILAIVLTGTIAVYAVRRRGGRADSQNGLHAQESVPPRIRERIDKLTALRQTYVLREATGNQAAGTVAMQIDTLVGDVTELFQRLKAKSSKAEQTRARDEYETKLDKLIAALDQDYLLDVITNPRLWDGPEQRIGEVQSAILAVDGQLLDNIRQVNSKQGMVFRGALDDIGGLR